MKFLKSLLRSAWIGQPLGPPKFPCTSEDSKLNDEVAAETGDVFLKFQNYWQSWHSSAHACTSSWLTNAERDAPVASVKVVVSASCLRGKRPSASSKLLRYLEALPMMYFLYPPDFSKHASNLSREWRPHCSIQLLLEVWKKQKQHTERKILYYCWKLSCIPFLFMSPWLLCRLRLIWGSPLSPDQFDVWINEETS